LIFGVVLWALVQAIGVPTLSAIAAVITQRPIHLCRLNVGS
jgi:hypothetical protein